MNNIIYVSAVVLLTLWMIGFFIYALGAFVHVLLILSILAVVYLAKRDNKVVAKS
ncbi:MAG TPA: DUF5670 family protein [Chryseolinea sp.]|nr:DUF5670 family protein [Chryseolinea sp.]